MKVEKRQTETYIITDIESLENIKVYVTNYIKEAEIEIHCWPEFWSSHLADIGYMTAQTSIIWHNNDYILEKLLKHPYEIDFQQICNTTNRTINVKVESDLAMVSNQIKQHFGDDWYQKLPRRKTAECMRLERIINAIRDAFIDEFLKS